MGYVVVSKREHQKIFKENYNGKKVRVFISYSSKDREVAGSLKRFLEKYGLEVFLAHEDIKPTINWQEEIMQNLKECDVFLPIISPSFGHSEWTDQETGIAIALKKFIVPIKLGKDPYGFISRLQACKGDSFSSIIQAIKDYSPLKESMIDCLLDVLEKAGNFDSASETIKEIETYETFTRPQVDQIIRISIKNDQVRLSWEGKKFLESIFTEYGAKIDTILAKVFAEVKDDFYAIVEED